MDDKMTRTARIFSICILILIPRVVTAEAAVDVDPPPGPSIFSDLQGEWLPIDFPEAVAKSKSVINAYPLPPYFSISISSEGGITAKGVGKPDLTGTLIKTGVDLAIKGGSGGSLRQIDLALMQDILTYRKNNDKPVTYRRMKAGESFASVLNTALLSGVYDSLKSGSAVTFSPSGALRGLGAYTRYEIDLSPEALKLAGGAFDVARLSGPKTPEKIFALYEDDGTLTFFPVIVLAGRYVRSGSSAFILAPRGGRPVRRR